LPTFEKTDQFQRDYDRHTAEERKLFREAVTRFVEDLSKEPTPRFRRGLRVKPMQNAPGIFEMTWETSDGRATFEFGEVGQVLPGELQVIWRRIGGHAVFGNP
jgi:hypothetical protein